MGGGDGGERDGDGRAMGWRCSFKRMSSSTGGSWPVQGKQKRKQESKILDGESVQAIIIVETSVCGHPRIQPIQSHRGVLRIEVYAGAIIMEIGFLGSGTVYLGSRRQGCLMML